MDYFDHRNYSSYLRKECWCQIGRKSVDCYIQQWCYIQRLEWYLFAVTNKYHSKRIQLTKRISAHSVAPGLAGSYRDYHLNSFLPSLWFYPQEIHEVLKRVSVWE